MRARVLVAIALFVLGCSAPSDRPAVPSKPKCDQTPSAPPSSPALEVLRADGEGYAPIVTDENLDRIHGPQGGTHFYVWVRTFTDKQDYFVVAASLRSSTDNAIGEGSTEFASCTSLWTEVEQITVFLDSPGVPLIGKLVVEATPDQGNPLSFEAPIKVWDSQVNQPPPPPPPPPNP